MQPCQEQRARADIAHLTDIKPGDYFYMCSDGMLEQSTDEEKLEMLRSVTEENKDNHTAHLIHIEKVIGANPLQAPVPPFLLPVLTVNSSRCQNESPDTVFLLPAPFFFRFHSVEYPSVPEACAIRSIPFFHAA